MYNRESSICLLFSLHKTIENFPVLAVEMEGEVMAQKNMVTSQAGIHGRGQKGNLKTSVFQKIYSNTSIKKITLKMVISSLANKNESNLKLSLKTCGRIEMNLE